MTIVYRAYVGETDGNLSILRPSWFSKFKCWKSFWDCFGGKVEIIVLWDGEMTGKFFDYIKSFNPNIVNYGKIGNKGGLFKTYELLKESKNEIVATVEDDYLILPECLDIVKEGFNYGFSMFTPYEHPERTMFPNHDICWGKEEIYLGRNCYFRSVESTTGTCFFKKSMFDKLYDKLVSFNVNDRPFFRDCYKNGIRLYSCMPSYATHVCQDRGINLMGPFIDWEKFNSTIKCQLE